MVPTMIRAGSRRHALLATGAVSAGLLAVVALTAATSGGRTAESARAAKIARGAYLVTIAGCSDCHTPGTLYGAPDTSRQLSGSELGWQGPWGVTYAANLTPDPETGLGRWSEADIVRALRTGTRPDGSPILPPMPWPNFARLTDEDADAIAAYLKSIPAIRHKVPARIGPGAPASGAVVSFPPPPAWDAPRPGAKAGPAPGAAGGAAAK